MLAEFENNLRARRLEALNDPRSTHELVSVILMETDEEAAWDAVLLLHYRGTREVFDVACGLCGSECSKERTLGANILGQLGVPERAFPKQSVATLLQLLRHERDEEVLQAICVAFGHLRKPEPIPALSKLKNHSSVMVRHGVVMGLLSLTEPLAIATLIEMSIDSDELVRDWATFGLGTQIDEDNVEFREALYARLFDTDEATRGEALVGLARRSDQRILKTLIRELENNTSASWLDYVAPQEWLRPGTSAVAADCAIQSGT